jgi:hypothetical protein
VRVREQRFKYALNRELLCRVVDYGKCGEYLYRDLSETLLFDLKLYGEPRVIPLRIEVVP